MIRISLCLAAIVTLILPPCYADTCADYPYTDGIDISENTDGVKIIATASTSVSFDDIDSIRDSHDEASLLAKAKISKFLSEDIYSDEDIKKAINESKMTGPGGVLISRNEVIKKVRHLRNSSNALLKGVMVLGDCYTPSVETRVTVGIKPDTIRQAEQSNAQIRSGGSNRASPSNGPDSGSLAPLRKSNGYSNTERLDDF
jgi:hypothetical protein